MFNIHRIIQCSINHSMFNGCFKVSTMLETMVHFLRFPMFNVYSCEYSMNHSMFKCLMFNEQFNVQGIFVNQQAIQCSTNHSMFNEGFKVSTLLGMSQLVLGMMVHFIHIQCSMYIQYSTNHSKFNAYSIFNKRFNVQ